MIKNDRQYRKTLTEIDRFAEAAVELRNLASTGEPMLRLQLEAAESLLADLQGQALDYERLRDGEIDSLTVDSFSDLPATLIRARIAQGCTHRELAQRLGVAEQQIQRYEANDYTGVKLSRLQEIADALGVEVHNRVYLRRSAAKRSRLRRRLHDAGLDDKFIKKALYRGEHSDDADADFSASVGRVFGIEEGDLLADDDLAPALEPAMAASFKVPEHASDRLTTTYALYANFLARLLIEATPEVQSKPLPDEWSSFIAAVEASSSVTLEGVIDFLWRRGTIVLPLADPGGFHGAFWKIDGRDVIVLKQGHRSRERWLFDLLHECRHSVQASGMADTSFLDGEEQFVDSGDEFEQDANEFAGAVALAGRAEELVQKAVVKASGKMPWLKRATREVAEEAGVNVGVLANYLAWRLSLQGENWWATAIALEGTERDAFEVARAALLHHVDIDGLDQEDRRILLDALSREE